MTTLKSKLRDEMRNVRVPSLILHSLKIKLICSFLNTVGWDICYWQSLQGLLRKLLFRLPEHKKTVTRMFEKAIKYALWYCVTEGKQIKTIVIYMCACARVCVLLCSKYVVVGWLVMTKKNRLITSPLFHRWVKFYATYPIVITTVYKVWIWSAKVSMRTLIMI